MKKTLLAVLSIGMLFTACKKDDLNPLPENPTPVTPAPTFRQTLMAQPWQIISWKGTELSDTTNVVDLLDFFMDDCSKDDRFRFMPNNVLRISEHLNVCDGNDTVTLAQWTLVDSSRALVLDFGWDEISGIGSTLGDTAFNLRSEINWLGVNFRTDMVFRKR